MYNTYWWDRIPRAKVLPSVPLFWLPGFLCEHSLGRSVVMHPASSREPVLLQHKLVFQKLIGFATPPELGPLGSLLLKVICCCIQGHSQKLTDSCITTCLSHLLCITYHGSCRSAVALLIWSTKVG